MYECMNDVKVYITTAPQSFKHTCIHIYLYNYKPLSTTIWKNILPQTRRTAKRQIISLLLNERWLKWVLLGVWGGGAEMCRYGEKGIRNT